MKEWITLILVVFGIPTLAVAAGLWFISFWPTFQEGLVTIAPHLLVVSAWILLVVFVFWVLLQIADEKKNDTQNG